MESYFEEPENQGQTAPQGDESAQPEPAAHGWIKMMRGPEAEELIKANPNAWILATIISRRARWSDKFNAEGLTRGEALLGDFTRYKMTRQQYRTALAFLVRSNFVTTRITNRGTIAKLADERLFDPLNLTANHQNNQRATSAQPPANPRPTNGQPLTKNDKKDKNEKEGEEQAPNSQGQNETGKPTLSQTDRISGEKELKRVEDAIGKIEIRYDSHATRSKEDQTELSRLRKCRKDLIAMLRYAV
jgi:hypothetical protein